MRKSTLLKLAGTFAAVMFSFGVMAQTYPAAINTNYVEATATTYQTTGLGLTLYVAPDPVYSPGYDGDGVPAYNASSQWQWVHGASFAAGTVVKAWANDNYVALINTDLPAAGSTRTFWVAERFGAAGCADATGTSHVVTVLDEPNATMIGANTGTTTWNVLTADKEFWLCNDGHDDDLTLTFTEAGTPYNAYAYTLTVTATGYDIDNNVVVGPTNVTGTYGNSIAATVATFVASPATFTIPAMDFVQLTGVDVRTKYEFTLATVASRISTLSHARAGVANAFYAPTVSQMVTYWLNLPPVTGPIYHIPNTFNF